MTLRRWSVRHFVAVVAAVTSLSLLAACGEDEKPELKRTPVSETPSASESPSASETPEPKRESAKAFIRRWNKVSDSMQVTGKTKPYLSLSLRSCRSCRDFASNVKKVYRQGGSIEFDGSRILKLKRVGGTTDKPEFDRTVELGETVLVESAGAEPRTLPGGRVTYLVVLQRNGESWKVAKLLQRGTE